MGSGESRGGDEVPWCSSDSSSATFTSDAIDELSVAVQLDCANVLIVMESVHALGVIVDTGFATAAGAAPTRTAKASVWTVVVIIRYTPARGKKDIHSYA